MHATSSRLLSTTSALILLIAAAPAWADPPMETAVTYQAPYTSFAGTHNDTDGCLPGATCALDADNSWVKPESGHYSAHLSYNREDSKAELQGEVAYGSATQSVRFKVPPHARKLIAIFTWKNLESEVSASASEGEIIAQSGLGAYAFCDSGCTVEHASVPVQAQRSDAGVEAPVTSYTTSDEVSMTVTVTATPTGRLPRHLYFYGYTYGAVFARETTVCTGGGCVGAGNAHAGSGSARLQAALAEVRITAE